MGKNVKSVNKSKAKKIEPKTNKAATGRQSKTKVAPASKKRVGMTKKVTASGRRESKGGAPKLKPVVRSSSEMKSTTKKVKTSGEELAMKKSGEHKAEIAKHDWSGSCGGQSGAKKDFGAAECAKKSAQMKPEPALKPISAPLASDTKKSAVIAPKKGSKGSITPEQRYRMVQEAAYYIAEKNGFVGDQHHFWVLAEKQIDTQLAKG